MSDSAEAGDYISRREIPRLFEETTIEELKQQFIKHPNAKGFVVEGFRRDIGQTFLFEEQLR